jgi:hypothetical protein
MPYVSKVSDLPNSGNAKQRRYHLSIWPLVDLPMMGLINRLSGPIDQEV